MSKYYLLDKPYVLEYAFYPCDDCREPPSYATDILVPVEEDICVACRFYLTDAGYPTILFFHGNGEVASDYDAIATYFFKANLNLIVAEFRGYGASNGAPTFANVISDAHTILNAVKKELEKRDFRKAIYIMGRSMGSVSALELARHHPKECRGLIIESGFPCASRIARRVGAPLLEQDIRQVEYDCLEKIRNITIPALIIHGSDDSLVSIEEAYTLERELGSKDKRLYIIRGADHNSVMAVDIAGYFQAIHEFIHR